MKQIKMFIPIFYSCILPILFAHKENNCFVCLLIKRMLLEIRITNVYLMEQLAKLLTIFCSAGVRRWFPCHVASPDAFVFKSACSFSHTCKKGYFSVSGYFRVNQTIQDKLPSSWDSIGHRVYRDSHQHGSYRQVCYRLEFEVVPPPLHQH